MLALFSLLCFTLVVILLAAELFTNTLEHLGESLGISEGVTGSLFAAVGTALPETMIPLIAVFTRASAKDVGEEIGVGAILGAPLMLSTLTVSLMALGALGRPAGARLMPEAGGLKRDLDYFLLAFALASAAMLVPAQAHLWRGLFSAALCALYLAYIVSTVNASARLVSQGHGTRAGQRLVLGRLRLPTNRLTIAIQGVLALGILVAGAQGFIHAVEGLGERLHLSPLLLSLLLVPLATELPEKINSLRWIRRGRDTLAFSNVTGAMVFQGTLLPALGIQLTPWSPRPEVLTGVIVTLCGAAWLRLISRGGSIASAWLACNGALYLGYLVLQLAPGASGL